MWISVASDQGFPISWRPIGKPDLSYPTYQGKLVQINFLFYSHESLTLTSNDKIIQEQSPPVIPKSFRLLNIEQVQLKKKKNIGESQSSVVSLVLSEHEKIKIVYI